MILLFSLIYGTNEVPPVTELPHSMEASSLPLADKRLSISANNAP